MFNLEPDEHGERTFDCQHCGKLNIRWKKGELIKNCQHCGEDVSCNPSEKKQDAKKAA